MAKEILVFCLFSYVVRADTDYELFFNNGWIPITNIQAYDTRRSEPENIPEKDIKEKTQFQNVNDFIQVVTPDVRRSKDYSPLKVNPTEFEKSKELFEEIKGVHDECKHHGRDHYTYYFKIANKLYKPSHLYIVKFSGSNICAGISNTETKKHNFHLSDMRFDRCLKVSKEISNGNEVPFTDEITNKNIYDGENTEDLNRTANTFERKNYEVTEEVESTDSNQGYVYETPKPNTSNKLNLTNKLFNILAKYNIRADDDLQNYVLSRTHKDENPTAPELVKPFDFKARGYNSLNHLPVDPLLAVFLSHYGHYLPSAYGIRSNYNNAYGYLASNNIHNNKPFGMYKMFSDNDSRS